MNVCYDEEELENFLKMAAEVSKEYPVVVSQFLQNTKEIEFDAVAQNGEVVEVRHLRARRVCRCTLR